MTTELEELHWPWTVFPTLDPRLEGYPFVGNFWFMTGLVIAYLYFVKILGPKLMADRPAFEITTIIKAYNFANIFINLFFTIQFSRYSYFGGGYSLFCQKMDHSRDENSIMLVKLGYYYCIIRVLDLLDTIFFVMRKKFNQITALHCSHHALVAWSGWLFVSVGCDGQVVLGIIVNSAVHVLMYTYYFLAACGPSVKPYLWWKRYITRIQIGQFVGLLFHIMIPIFYDCGYPRGLLVWAFAQGTLGLVLFINFYLKSYIVKHNPTPEIQSKSSGTSYDRLKEAKRA
ncbi:elongation of very long chain fatty acids protein 1 [Galendromus occidentalis]|uniref:Elongation of very long chain fatty acids protein n=1 Tax=Galendromus occidentalis TaxID=34638 RepID=A0AAJ6QUY3_9ACAR|nr:elongation of very long chain fatty acids protein 1 [Galendromus occidentalis]